MKLPSIQYERQVQRFGRQSIMAPQRIANIRAQAAALEGQGLRQIALGLGQLGESLQQIEKQQAVDEYNNALAQAQIEMVKAEAQINAGPEVKVSDFPEVGQIGRDFSQPMAKPDGSGVELTDIPVAPTWEVSVPAYSKRLQTIQDKALAGMSNSRAKQKFAAQFGLMRARAEANQMAKAAEQRREFNLLRAGYAEQKYLQVGDEEGAKAMWKQLVATGQVTAADAMKRWLEIEYTADANALVSILANGDNSQVNRAILSIPTRLRGTPEQRSAWLSRAVSERDRRKREAAAAASRGRAAAGRQALARVAAGEMSWEELQSVLPRVSNGASLLAAWERQNEAEIADAEAAAEADLALAVSQGEKSSEQAAAEAHSQGLGAEAIMRAYRFGDTVAPDTLSDSEVAAREFQQVLWDIRSSDAPLEERKVAAQQMLDTYAGRMSAAGLRSAQNDIESMAEAPFRSEVYNASMDRAALILVKTSRNNIGLNNDAAAQAAYAEVERLARDYIRRKGSDEGLEEFVNAEIYKRANKTSTKNINKQSAITFYQDADVPIVMGANNKPDPKATQEQALAEYGRLRNEYENLRKNNANPMTIANKKKDLEAQLKRLAKIDEINERLRSGQR